MPGNEMHKIRKAITLNVDCICMDMEDGVASNRKQQARTTIVEALTQFDFGKAEKLARINPVGSGLETADLDAVLPARPDGIVIPKVGDAEQVRWVSRKISSAEAEHNFPDGAIRLVVLVESARAIVNLAEIAAADPRIEALIFGADDLAGDIGAKRSASATEVFYARSKVVTYATAFVLQAIDMVYINLDDNPGLTREAQEGANMGYDGKQIIHPSQVAPVQEAFTPTTEAIKQAQHIMTAFRKHEEEGIGAFALDGKMVDAPMIKAAQNVLSLAKAAGKIQ
jgi:citrate lyase beta subunit